MKRISLLLALLAAVAVPTAEAQFRNEAPSPYQWTGSVIRPVAQSPAAFASSPLLRQVRMSHSYEMTMGSFGGQMYNRNQYTNTLMLDFNDRMTGRVDVAFAHSPFGNGMMMHQGPQIYLRNAEFRYRLSERTVFQVSFRHEPGGYGLMNPMYRGY
jgi:hypothetical protein